MKKYILTIILIFFAATAFGKPIGGPPPPSTGLQTYTVATVPSAAANPNMAIIVTDGNTDTDCETTGTGTTKNICISDGTNWIIAGDGTSGTIGGLSVDTAEAGDDGLFLFVDWGNSKIDYGTTAGLGDMLAAAYAEGEAPNDAIDTDAGGTNADSSAATGIAQVTAGTWSWSNTIAGNVALDDGSGDSPTFTLQDEGDKTFVIQKLDAGQAALVNNEGAIRLEPSNVTADGMDITAAAGALEIDTYGSSSLTISADGGAINLRPSGDDDDYVALTTTGDATTINFVGQDGIITADGGDISFDNENLVTTGTFGSGTITESGNDPIFNFNETDGTDWQLRVDDTGNSFEIGSSAGGVGDNVELEIDEDGDLHITGSLFIPAAKGIELNDASANTLTAAAGVLSIEGNALLGADDAALTGDPTLTDGDPTFTFIDSTNSGEVQIAISDNADPDGIVDFKVDEAGTLTSYLQLDGANSTVDVLKNATFAGTVGITGVLTATAAGANITLADGQLIDLSGITPSDAADEGLILPTWADVTPSTDTPFITYDPDSNAIKVYEGGWVSISGGAGAPVDAKYIVWDALNGTLSGEMVLAGGTGVDLTGSGPGYAANGTLTASFDATELTDLTWSDNASAAIVWTFNVSGTDHTVTWGNGLATFGDAVTVTDTLTATNGIALGTSKSITGTTGLTIGGGSETVAVNGTNFVLSAAGAITTVGAITSSGVVTSTGFTIGSAAITEAELEILDGATLSTTDINIIDGISDSGTLTAAELLYVDGVTSSIQTQLNSKGTLASAQTISANWVNTAFPWADNEVADNLTISGGTVDNSIVGGSTAAAGHFTTLSTSDAFTVGGNIALGANEIQSTGNIILQLGDNAGVNSFIVQDSDSATAWSLNSDGQVTVMAKNNPYVFFNDDDMATEFAIRSTDTTTDRLSFGKTTDAMASNFTELAYLDINGSFSISSGQTYQIAGSGIETEMTTGGDQEIDGDKLDIDWTPTYYTPATTPSEADNADNLTAHLYGIDQAIGAAGIGTLLGLTDVGGSDVYTTGYILIADGDSYDPKAIQSPFSLANDGTLSIVGAVDFADNDLTSIDKLEGVTTATYLDLGDEETVLATTLDNAENDEEALSIVYTTNKATSGDDYGLKIIKTDTASPDNSYLIWAGVGATPMFYVTDEGEAYLPNSTLKVGTDPDIKFSTPGAGLIWVSSDSGADIIWTIPLYANDGFVVTGGDITTQNAPDWDLLDGVSSALSFDTGGKAGIINVITTNDAEGVTMSGTLGVTGATTLTGGIASIGAASDLSGNTVTLGTIAGTLSDGTASWNTSTQVLDGFADLSLSNDLLLASGSIVNFDSGDVTITHSAGTLTVGGDGDVTLAIGATDITDGTATWDGGANTLAGFASVSATTLTDGTASLSSGALTGITHISYPAPTVDDPDNWTMDGYGVWVATADGTADLPAVVAGMHFMVVVEGASTVQLNSDDSGTADTIYLDGAAETQDEDIVSSGTAGDTITCFYRSADAWSCTSDGWDGATD